MYRCEGVEREGDDRVRLLGDELGCVEVVAGCSEGELCAPCVSLGCEDRGRDEHCFCELPFVVDFQRGANGLCYVVGGGVEAAGLEFGTCCRAELSYELVEGVSGL